MASSSSSSSVTPNDVLKLNGPTKDFLCPLSANTYGIDFLSFKIRDMDTQTVVFEVAKDPNQTPVSYPPDFDLNQLRSINYKFPAQFLRYETVGTTYVMQRAQTRQRQSNEKGRGASCMQQLQWRSLHANEEQVRMARIMC